MPGAGSLRALEHLEKHAPKDGTAVDLFDYTQITNSLLTPDKVPIDFRKFQWIGSVAAGSGGLLRLAHGHRQTVADMQRLPVINMGRTNPGTSSDTQQKSCASCSRSTSTPSPAMPAARKAFIAVERGELEGGCMTWASLPPCWIGNDPACRVPRPAAQCSSPACPTFSRA